MSVPSAAEPVAIRCVSAQPADEASAAAPLATGALWVVAGRIAGMGATLLLYLLIPRCLTPAECGKFLVIQNLVLLGALLGAGGLPLTMVKLLGEGLALRERAWLRGALSSGSQLLLVTSLAIAAVFSGWLATGGARRLKLDPSPVWLGVFGITLLLLAWQWVLVEAIRGLGELRWASLFAGGQSGGPLATLLFIGLLLTATTLNTPTATTAMTLYAAGLAATFPGILLGLRWAWCEATNSLTEPTVNRAAATPMLKSIWLTSLPICAGQIFAFITLSVDLPIASAFCSSTDVALLGQARRLLLMLQLPGQMAVMTLLPSVARMYFEGRTQELEQLIRRATTLSALFAIPAAVVLLAVPGLSLSILFGESYGAGATILIALTIGQLVAVHNGMAGYVLIVTGHQRAVVLINACTALLMIVAGPIAAARGGVLGLSIATALVLAVQSTLEWWLAWRLLNIRTHIDWKLILPRSLR